MNRGETARFRAYERHLASEQGPPPVQVTKSEADMQNALMRSGQVIHELIRKRDSLKELAAPDHWIKPSKESQESMRRAAGAIQLAINEEQSRYDEFVKLRDEARNQRTT